MAAFGHSSFLLTLAVSSLVGPALGNSRQWSGVLTPEVPEIGVRIDFSERLQFNLKNLEPNAAYEVLLSHSAYPPVVFSIELPGRNKPARALLNTEKAVFHTDKEGRVNGEAEPYIIIAASAAGMRAPGIPLDKRAKFDIVVHRVHLGVPTQAIALILAIVAAVVLSLKYVHPRLMAHFLSIGKTAHRRDI